MKTRRKILLYSAIIILALFVLAAAFPGLFTPYGRKDSFGPWIASCPAHILGTNSLGYDVFTELVYGTRDTLIISVASSLLTIFIGFFIGILSAGRGVACVISDGLTNIFALFPRLVATIVLSGFFGSSVLNTVLLISGFSWVPVARAVRAKLINIKNKEYIEICRLYGYTRLHTVIYHVLPNLKDIMLSKFLVSITSCIMMESTLSFLGFGDTYYPTWGVMINFAKDRGAILRGAYSCLLAPCACIMLLSLAFYFLSVYAETGQSSIKV